MRYRTLGKTGLRVSEIGFGCWGIGGPPDWASTDEDALDALNLAVDLGIDLFDTALVYGNGHSESLVGRLVRERSERLYVVTKIPPKNRIWPARVGTPLQEAFPHEYIIEMTEQNLRNLGLERIDIQLMHVWLDEWAQVDEWKEAVVQLKQQGKIDLFGVSLNFPYGGGDNGIPGMQTGAIDVVEVVYNIYEQRPQYDVLPAAVRAGVGVIARCPLDEGALSGKITPGTTWPEGSFQGFYFRGERTREVYERAKTLQWLIRDDVESLPEAALRFSLSRPEVSAVIVGMTNTEHLRVNVKASDKGGLKPEDLEQLKAWAWPHIFWA